MRRFVSFFGEKSPVFDELNERAKVYAEQKGFEYIWAPQKPFVKENVIEQLQKSDVGLIDVEPYDNSIFSQIHARCKLLIRFGVGYDKVDLRAASANGICVARTTGANSASVAEMALTMILAARRQMRINRSTVNSGKWVKNVGTETLGKTVGIVGFGAIGKTLARLLEGFGCKILVYDRHPMQKNLDEFHAAYCDLDELVSRSDAISIHVPYTAETHHMFDAGRIGKMKKDAVLICTARGNIVDEDALYEALVSNRIGGAGLDVYTQEPLPGDSKLVGLDNVILTPHVASQTKEALWATYEKAIDIAEAFFEGRDIAEADLLNPDYDKG